MATTISETHYGVYDGSILVGPVFQLPEDALAAHRQLVVDYQALGRSDVELTVVVVKSTTVTEDLEPYVPEDAPAE